MKFHEYANLFPMMPEADIQRLAEDISEKGQSDSIITYQGEILDGRNRFQACQLKSIDPRFEPYTGEDPLGFVISHNLHRRHLTESQRAMVAAKMASLRKGGDRRSADFKVPIGTLKSSTQNRDEAAGLLNVGAASVGRAKAVIRNGIPELAKLVEVGTVTVNAACQVAKLPQDLQEELVRRGVDAIKEAAKDGRQQAKRAVTEAVEQEPAPEPDVVVVDGTKPGEGPKRERLPKFIPDDAERLWLLAKTDLDKILETDRSRERVLREVMIYVQNRIQNNK